MIRMKKFFVGLLSFSLLLVLSWPLLAQDIKTVKKLYCPYCGMTNLTVSKFCNACGSKLPAPKPSPPLQEERLEIPRKAVSTESTTAILASSDSLQSKTQEIKKPPLKFGKVLGEFAAGWGGALALGFIGFHIGGGCSWLRDSDPSCSLGKEETSLLGALLGVIIGSSIGVYLVGNTGNETGSYPATLSGSALGLFVPILSSPFGATLAFNMTRRYKTTPFNSGTGVINLRNNDELNLSALNFYYRHHPVNGKLVPTINLVQVNF